MNLEFDLLRIPIVFLCLIATFLFFFSAFISVYWWDDFWKYNEHSEKGYLGTVRHFYLNWDGRAISPLFTLRNFISWNVHYSYAFIPSLLALSVLLATSYFLALLIGIDNLRLGKQEKILILVKK